MDSFIKERKKLAVTKGDQRCGMDYIFEAQEKGEINEDNMLYLLDNMNTAGMETIVWSLEWVIAELVNHPEVQQKIREELDAVVAPGIPMTESDIVKLPYLQAVMKESLRLHITLPFVPRLNVPQTKLGGYDIPAGTKVLVNIWWLANNPELWDNPQDFIPERFLQDDNKIEFHGNDFRFLPFGAGRRRCPGIHMALANVALTVGRLVQNFELLPPPGQSKVDVSDKGGQFSLPILNQTLLVAKPRPSAST
jgi:trans-cinnamate 4-monooxygenase